MDSVTSYGTAAGLGAAAVYGWIKVGPLLIGKLAGNGNGNGNGNGASLELKIQNVMERVGSTMMAPVNASMSRMEAALTRMETVQNNLNASLVAFAAAEQARVLAGLGRPHGD